MTEFTKTCSAELEGVQVGDSIYVTTNVALYARFGVERYEVVKVTPKQLKAVKVLYDNHKTSKQVAFNKITGVEITSRTWRHFIIARDQTATAEKKWNTARDIYLQHQDIEQEREHDRITHDVHLRRMLIGSQQVEELCIVSEMETDRDIKELTAQDIQFLENVIDQWHIRNHKGAN